MENTPIYFVVDFVINWNYVGTWFFGFVFGIIATIVFVLLSD